MRNRWLSGCVTAGVLALVASVPRAAPRPGRCRRTGGAGARTWTGRTPPAVDDGRQSGPLAAAAAARPGPPHHRSRLRAGRMDA